MSRTLLCLTLLACGSLTPCGAAADDPPSGDKTPFTDEQFESWTFPGAVRLPVGVTSEDRLIWCVMDKDALDYRSPSQRVAFIVGMGQSPSEAMAALRAISQLEEAQGRRVLRAVVPVADPDAMTALLNEDESDAATSSFPPHGDAYHTRNETSAATLWRFLGWFAPDVVVEFHGENDPALKRALATDELSNAAAWPADSLAAAVRSQDVARTGTIRSLRLPASFVARSPASMDARTRRALGYEDVDVPNPSPSRAHQEILRRLNRSPLKVAAELTPHYGQQLKAVSYQPALAVIARLRLSELTGQADERQAVSDILEPYLTGERPALGMPANGSQIAGQLVFSAWAERTRDPRAVELVIRAADLAFNPDGTSREAMPTHNEMSDAVFMGCPILTAAGKLSGEPRYLEMAAKHLEFMRSLCRREDGLYRHSPLCEAPWGRGNGFPALGLSLCLTDLDDILADKQASPALKAAAQRGRDVMLPAFQEHVQALLSHQDLTGTWRQVIDHPGAYRELTATCMITFAMARGVRRGWLDEASFRPVIDRAWEGIKVRIGREGELLDVCTGTGKQKTLRDYLNRTAILGRDERGGAMALIAAVEMAELSADD
jgi:rhamnogalacturonyl hydrolase YesR